MPQVKDYMTSNVLTTLPDTTLKDAAKMMSAENRGSIVVVDSGKPIAILTERDFLRRVVAQGLSPEEKRVKDIMSSPLVTIGPEEPLKRAAKLMTERAIRRLPVVKGGKLVGIITEADLARLEPHELL